MAWTEKRGDQYRVRFRRPDGKVETDSVHPTQASARNRANDMETDQRRIAHYDPSAGKITLREWSELWAAAHDVSEVTWAKYTLMLHKHILPRFGDLALNEITRMMVKGWVKTLRVGREDSTVASIVSLLSQLFNEAIDDGRLALNPCRRLRIVTGTRPERPHATPAQVLQIAERCTFTEYVMIITAAYTGLRWGEINALQRRNVRLEEKRLYVDADEGALHEVAGKLYLGPPKTPASVRSILLPDFLVELLIQYLDSHNHEHVFLGRDGGYQRRSNFERRTWIPAVRGNPRHDIPPVVPAMVFHDLRHTHKTWMIEDDIPEAAQAKRLGHKLRGVQGIYSHVTTTVEKRVADRMQNRWEHLTGEAGETDAVAA